MGALTSGLVLVGPALLFFALFVMLERADRPTATVAVVWAVLIVDTTLYASQNVVPTGIFHPVAGSLSYRLIDVVVVAALVARAVASPRPRRVTYAGLLWVAVILWILTSALVGVLNDNDTTLVSFEAKVAIYLGAMAITAGVPFRRYVEGTSILRLVRISAVVAALLVVADKTGLRLAASIPGLPLVDAGRLGSDAGTLFAAIGVLALAIGVYERQHRVRWLLPAVPLLVAAPAADQRAALLALVVSLLLLGACMSTGRHRVRVTVTEMGLVAITAVALVLTPVLLQLGAGSRTAVVPYVPELTQTLYGRAKVLSAQERINQYRAARKLIEARPLFGWGLGKEYVYYRTGFGRFEKSNLTHNILTDLWIRSGLVGLLLFLVALTTTLVLGIRRWLAEHDERAAAVLLGSLCVVVGLIPKGLVENLFEKYRMALLLGLMLGMVSSAVRSRPELLSAEVGTDRPQLPHPGPAADVAAHA
ncbi:MAG: O-Antigen ligase [Solirubrobacteraceae bacterium]|nr:O-Antigen ligase [Solirubrobacteraceae bacterium]